ncbi:hypothetical protein NDU88_004200 [Pleurodeles waltl]|uniref:Uncharacterized protein n=1 Tax=Pleurodeles waltl TaxID=8319 RepID=A0AAV7RGI0_PLEWA|nr:hypothetical protein NDU88_004200 [Pleurodeles waltl]
MLLTLPSWNKEHGSKNARSNGDTSNMKIPESTVTTTGLYHRFSGKSRKPSDVDLFGEALRHQMGKQTSTERIAGVKSELAMA